MLVEPKIIAAVVVAIVVMVTVSGLGTDLSCLLLSAVGENPRLNVK